MLGLSRKTGERFILTTPNDGPIVIEVKRISAGRVWLNFEAAKSIRILREELTNETQP